MTVSLSLANLVTFGQVDLRNKALKTKNDCALTIFCQWERAELICCINDKIMLKVIKITKKKRQGNSQDSGQVNNTVR